MNSEFGIILETEVTNIFPVLTQNLADATEESHKIPGLKFFCSSPQLYQANSVSAFSSN
jgi:hypothetical protein